MFGNGAKNPLGRDFEHIPGGRLWDLLGGSMLFRSVFRSGHKHIQMCRHHLHLCVPSSTLQLEAHAEARSKEPLGTFGNHCCYCLQELQAGSEMEALMPPEWIACGALRILNLLFFTQQVREQKHHLNHLKSINRQVPVRLRWEESDEQQEFGL